jgi:hypothetical protein
VLPLEVGGATAGVYYLSVRGPGERPSWSLTVTSELWAITCGPDTVLSAASQVEAYNADEVEAYDDAPVAFLVGKRVTGVEGSDPEGGEIVFVFDGGYRLEIHHDPDQYEAFVLMVPGWFTVGH